MWKKLKKLHLEANGRAITDLFADDPHRAERFSILSGDLFLDFSKTNIDRNTFEELISLADARSVEDKRDSMFLGQVVNATENRPALHTALRDPNGTEVLVDDRDVKCAIRSSLEKMQELVENIQNGSLRGASGGKFTDVLNVGIGGSDLGPAMACRALPRHRKGLRAHFVSNIDSAHLTDIITDLDPATTFVIVVSKTFTTLETITNAKTACAWLASSHSNAVAHQVAAVTSADERAQQFGIQENMIFRFADWVGGRYSVWGPVGLSLMLSIGPQAFAEFLSGARSMDDHFRTASLDRNLPVVMALVGIWHNQVCAFPARVVLPYEQRLSLLPSYLQQLEMESNGKSVAIDGGRLGHDCGPMIWGETGTNGQHAFFQWLHQGTRTVPCEFLLGAAGKDRHLPWHHDALVANCLAQSAALMTGRRIDPVLRESRKTRKTESSPDIVAPYRAFDGNRPSTTLIYPELTPHTLGQIIALYEHRVFVEGVILGINSFDQWGVELGKELARRFTPFVERPGQLPDADGSTLLQLKTVHDFRSKLGIPEPSDR